MAERFTKYAGSGIMQSADDPSMLLVGSPVPDWVVAPKGLDEAGQRFNVQAPRIDPCPMCKATVRHLVAISDDVLKLLGTRP